MSQDRTEASIDLIMRLIPHRYPFLLIDKVVDIRGIQSGTGIKNITMNEPQFTGHFPGQPIMPGVLMVEAMAQTAAVVVGSSLGLEDKNMKVYFMGIDSCKFRKMVVPGDVLKLHVKTVRGRPGGKVWRFSGQAMVDGEMACEAEFTAMMDGLTKGDS